MNSVHPWPSLLPKKNFAIPEIALFLYHNHKQIMINNLHIHHHHLAHGVSCDGIM